MYVCTYVWSYRLCQGTERALRSTAWKLGQGCCPPGPPPPPDQGPMYVCMYV